MTETIFGKNVFDFFSLAHVPSASMGRAGVMTYTAADCQGAIKMFWLHFWGAVMFSIFLYSLWCIPVQCVLWPWKAIK